MDSVEKIEKLNRFSSRPGLEKMSRLMDILGNPQDRLRFIHVAGTNGKGSVCRYLYCALKEEGINVGIFISPHLEVFNERFEYNGEYITDEELKDYTDRVMFAAERLQEEGFEALNEFETITAIAFLYFEEKGADIVVLEVGLGGRFDSTNVIKEPLASVITSISLDHTERLGHTIGEIAYEKAGIIKAGCPVITSAKEPEALSVIESTAKELGAMYFESSRLKYAKNSNTGYENKFSVNLQGLDFDDLSLNMLGEHQIENAICALATLCILVERGEISLKRSSIYDGFSKAKQIGRFEIVSEQPLIVLDGAHNKDGAHALKRTIEEYFKGSKVQIVTGMMKDKDTMGALSELVQISHDFVCTAPPSYRKLDPAEFADEVRALGGNAVAIDDAAKALEFALSRAESYDLTLCTGSLYLIGDYRKLILGKNV